MRYIWLSELFGNVPLHNSLEIPLYHHFLRSGDIIKESGESGSIGKESMTMLPKAWGDNV
jgi:hypothetical protein